MNGFQQSVWRLAQYLRKNFPQQVEENEKGPIEESSAVDLAIKLLDKKYPFAQFAKDQSSDFKPCPFCGSTYINHESMNFGRWARCQTCSCTGGYIFDFEKDVPHTKEEVIKRWNVRQVK